MNRWMKYRVAYRANGYRSETVVEAMGPEDAGRRVVEHLKEHNIEVAVTSVAAINPQGGAR